jgi:hypothetical protein
MTTAAVTVRRRPARFRRVSLTAAGRLLRLELRRNVTPGLLLPLAALCWFAGPYRVPMEYGPFWEQRALVMLDHFAPLLGFAAGAAAWMGSREGRRRITDQVLATPRPGWARRLATLAATASWLLLGYLGLVAALYGVTATQATWGGPAWWPVAVGAAALAAACSIGFAFGVLIPSRFTPPLVVIGAFFLSLIGVSHDTNPYAQLSGTTGVPPADIGVFYRYPPDLAIVQVMFLGGLAVAALGVLGLPAASARRRLRPAAALVTAVGLAAAGTAAGLAGTAVSGANGLVIPALHDAAAEGPIPYAPVCSGAAIPVCVHPAFRPYQASVSAALDPVLDELAGLPGAPVRAVQLATSELNGTNWGADIRGTPPVLRFSLSQTSSSVIDGLQDNLVVTFVAGSNADGNGGTPAQQAVEAALLTAAGGHPASGLPQLGPAVSAAATRLRALPAAQRHAWLAAHLPALRAGHLTPAQIP